jgi:DNA-binding PadR family transcriptional regulator
MKFLSRSEEMILLAILKLRDNAYVVTIQQELKKMTGKIWALGALFVTLDRMTRKGYVQSRFSKPTAERGGRRKRLYKLTPTAVDALNAVRKLQTSIWSDVSALSKEDFA